MQIVDIRRVLYQAEIEELGGYLLAQALYVHRALRRPVDDVLQCLGGAAGVHAAGHGLPLWAGDGLSADRTVFRHLEGVLVAGALLGEGADDLWDHVPRPLDHDHVTDEDALLPYVVFVVQRRARDGHAPDVDRSEQRLRRQGPGSTDVHDDVFESGTSRERLELVRYRPARRLRHRAQSPLLVPGVDLHNDAVDLVPERLALAGPVRALLDYRLYLFVQRVRVDPQAVALQGVECRRVALVPFATLPDPVAEDAQRSRGGDPGIQLPDRARRQVARVGERPLSLGLLAPVELLEPVQRYVDLAPRLKHLGVIPREPLGDRPDGPQVGRNVLADGAVAARGAPHEEPVLVAQGDREAVYLELGNVARLFVFPKEAADPGIPLVEVFELAGVRQREHRHGVTDLFELFQGFGTHPLRRGVGGHELGVLAFEGFELLVESVVLGVADLRGILHVVTTVVVADQLAQILDPAPDVQLFGHGTIIRVSRHPLKEKLPLREGLHRILVS